MDCTELSTGEKARVQNARVHQRSERKNVSTATWPPSRSRVDLGIPLQHPSVSRLHYRTEWNGDAHCGKSGTFSRKSNSPHANIFISPGNLGSLP
jgi:hypothetical protein